MSDEHDDDKTQQHMPWEDGLPTAPDVTAIQKQWPDLKVGDRVTYEDICALLKLDWRSSRFKSVTTAWRKRELEAGRVIESDPGVSFYVASAEQTSAKTYGVFKFIGRKARKHRRFLSVQHTEDAVLAATINHQGKLIMNIEREAKKSRMNLLPSTAATATPQITPPKQRQG